MRIQHNIMAMNAYRNYTNNVSAMKQNLEKLSSGYKINRAGDDAAGLAISEKMRAQITGLKTAQKNAKDGISLIQTAEGALTEVHDMLNRMVELASMSANGTYDNTTDRAQLQKEMDQLTSEINRIADSANFNGIKLLDGSMDAATKTSIKYSDINNKAVGTNAILPDGKDADKGLVGIIGTNTITYQESGVPQKTKFSVDLGNINWKVDKNALDPEDENCKVQFQVQFPSTTTNTDGGADVGMIGWEFSSTDLEKFKACVDDETGLVNMSELVKVFGDDMKTMTDPADGHTNHIRVDVAGATKDDKDAPHSGFDVSVDGTKLVFELCDLASATKEELNANWGDIRVVGAVTTTNAEGNAVTVKGGNKSDGTPGGDDGFTGWNVGTTDMVKGVQSEGDRMANTVLDMSKAGFNTDDATKNDGWSITVDGKSYILAVGDSDVAKYSGNAVVVKVGAQDTVDDQLRELANAINAGSSTWSVGANQKEAVHLGAQGNTSDTENTHNTANDKHVYGLTFAQIAKTNDEDLTTVEGIAKALKVGKVSASTTTTKGVGKSLTLQIGDTAESFNQLKVDVADCHAKALGIGDVDISTQDGAAAAIDKIKAAINTVSDIRGSLGATQNRLDHTINNLSVMQENIQDAESTIRDVDVAEEMMAYTKNNILIQSAQAMLAQANQVPQGVLQLLQ